MFSDFFASVTLSHKMKIAFHNELVLLFTCTLKDK
jgi:hypothetical protein